jgi:hypothetical protein
LNEQEHVELRKVLNVGGNSKEIAIPPCFSGWQHDLLDIDPACSPDILCDARDLINTTPRVYDAVYCSHNLEHYYQHDVLRVLAGFRLVLKKDGFAYIRVPDGAAVMKLAVENGLDFEDVLYISPAGPIRVHDVLYGFSSRIEQNGNDFFAHKCGFSKNSLTNLLASSGFKHFFVCEHDLELEAYAFTQQPTAFHQRLLRMQP